MKPDVLVFQTPPSLKPETHIYDIFASITVRWRLAWEPRGETYKDPRLIQKVAELGVVIALDPLKRDPLPSALQYFRLHGVGKGEVSYRYKYTEDDLHKLASVVRSLKAETVYVMFNNVYMHRDALRFKQLLNAT
jgi:Uncharacterized conserved protein